MGRGLVKIGGAETDPEDIRFVKRPGIWPRANAKGRYNLGSFDEMNYVISYDMLDSEKVVAALDEAGRVHVICTGSNAHAPLMEADFGREMQEVKHPYTKGVVGQRGMDY